MSNREQREEAEKKLYELGNIWEEPNRKPRPLVEVRRDREMSISEVAAAIGLGYDYYRRLEQGKFAPSSGVKETLCQIFACQASDIIWPTLEETKPVSLKRWTFQAGQTYVFIPVSIQHGGKAKTEFIKSKNRRMRYLRDVGVNHIFEDARRGGLECFIDAQLMDYAITTA